MTTAEAVESPNLLPRIAAGDSGAVEACLDRYGPIVYGMARRFFRDGSLADDVTQDVFIDVWKSAGRFDPNCAPESVFVVQIARRRMIDRLRRMKARPSGGSIENAPEPATEDAMAAIERSDEAARAYEAMQQLSPEQREVLGLSIGQGLSYSEVASKLAIPLGTVKSHARRGLIRVRQLLGLQVQENVSN